MTPSDLKQSDDLLYRQWAEWKHDIDALSDEFRVDMERMSRELELPAERRKQG